MDGRITVRQLMDHTSVLFNFLGPLALENTFMSMGELPPARYGAAHPWVDVDSDGELENLSGTPQTWNARRLMNLFCPGKVAE